MSPSAARPVDDSSVSATRDRSGARSRAADGAVGQGDHHREAVRDDVVHLAGDPAALGSAGELGLPVPVPRQGVGPLHEVGQVLAPVAHADPDRHRGEHEDHQAGRVAQPVVGEDDVAVRRRARSGRRSAASQSHTASGRRANADDGRQPGRRARGATRPPRRGRRPTASSSPPKRPGDGQRRARPSATTAPVTTRGRDRRHDERRGRRRRRRRARPAAGESAPSPRPGGAGRQRGQSPPPRRPSPRVPHEEATDRAQPARVQLGEGPGARSRPHSPIAARRGRVRRPGGAAAPRPRAPRTTTQATSTP